MAEATKRSFTGGEITPSLHARTDLNKYQNSLKTAINMIVLAEGGAINRPGFQHISVINESFLVPFQFNSDDSNILVFSEEKLKIFTNGKLIKEIHSPYSLNDMKDAQFVQSADVITLAHIKHPIRTLTRYSATDWKFADIKFSVDIEPPKSLKITTVGTDSESHSKKYDYVVTAVIDGRESGHSHEITINTNALNATWGNRIQWNGVGDSFNIYKSVSPSTNIYGWIGNSKTTEFTDFNIAPVSSEGIVKQTNPFNKIQLTVDNAGSAKVGEAVSNASFSGEIIRISGKVFTFANVYGVPKTGNTIKSDRVTLNATGQISIGAIIKSNTGEGLVSNKEGTKLTVQILNGTLTNGQAITISGNSKTTYKVSLLVPKSSSSETVVNADGSKTTTTTTINSDGSKTVTTKTELPGGSEQAAATTTEVFAASNSTTNQTNGFQAPAPLAIGDSFSGPSGVTGTFVSVSTLFGNEQTFVSEDINGTLKVGETIYVNNKPIQITDAYQNNIESTGAITTSPILTFNATIADIKQISNPSVINYYQQRLMLANTEEQPQTTYASRTSDYYDFRKTEPAGDSDSIEFTLASGQINEIRHIVSMKDLLLLTSGGVWKVTEGQNEVLTPTSAGVRKLSKFGSSKIRPLKIGESVLFIQSKQSRIRDLYDLGQYQSDDLSILSQHLFHGHKIVSWCYQEEPHGIVWAVRDDGILLGLTYHKAHQVWGWHRHDTQGKFKSVACVVENGSDYVYAVIERDNDHYLERMAQRKDGDHTEYRFLDGYVTAKDTSKISNVTFKNKEITVLADGFVHRIKAVGGVVTLPRKASSIVAGFSYNSDIETLDLDIPGKKINISDVTLRLLKTVGAKIGSSFDDLTDGKWRKKADSYGPTQEFSGEFNQRLGSGWSKKGRLCIRQDKPLPITVLSITTDSIIGGRK